MKILWHDLEKLHANMEIDRINPSSDSVPDHTNNSHLIIWIVELP